MSSSTRRLATLWLICSPALLASAPEWLRAAAQTQPPKPAGNADEAILLDEQITTVGESGEVKTLYRRAYKILRPETSNRKLVSAYFDSETRLSYLKGWSILRGEKAYDIKEKNAIETGAFTDALYQDTRCKLLEMPSAEAGAVVGYEYEQKRRSTMLQDIWDFQQNVPVRMARFELRLPQGWKYKADWLNHPIIEPHRANDNTWIWELEDLPAIEPEPGMPNWRTIAGSLGVTYYRQGANSDQQSQPAWRDVGLWYTRLAAERCKSNPAIRQKVIELTAAAPAVMDKIRALTVFVQKDIRYVAIEIGIGGYQPHAAEDVFTNRYGDCKDKATLLRVMLAEIGVDSYYVLINSSRGIVSPNFPSALRFNHVILAIRLRAETGNEALWSVERDPHRGTLLYFDPTDTLVPLGILPEDLQMSYGLLVSETGGELRQLPLIAPAVNKLLRIAKVTLKDSGAIQGTVTEIRTGALASELRAQLLGASTADRNKVLEAFLGKFIGSSVLRGSQVENLESPDVSLVVGYSFEAAGYAKSVGDLLLIRPRLLGQKAETPDSKFTTGRKYPIEIPYTSLQSDVVEITLPQGYAVDEVPAAVDIAMPFGEYHSRCEIAGTVLHYTRSYQINALYVPAEQWNEFRSFNIRIATDERNNAVLKAAR